LGGAEDLTVASTPANVDREAHPNSVDLATRAQHEKSFETVAAEQTGATRPTRARDLSGCEDVAIAHEPGHADVTVLTR
jgi:hypothetical protein